MVRVVSRVALGAVERRNNTVAPSLVAFGPEEGEYLAAHVDAVCGQGELGARSVFLDGSPVPALLHRVRTGDDADFVAGAGELQDRLARSMQGVSRASDCVFGVVVTRDLSRDSADVTLLKLDAESTAARMAQIEGRVTLTVLKNLLPEPGRLQKAVSWPDPRAGSQAVALDRNQRGALYFEAAFDLRVSPKSVDAEKILAQTIIAHVPQPRIAAAFDAAAPLAGPMDLVLQQVAEAGFPELGPAAGDVSPDGRPVGLVRSFKLAAQKVIWRAMGIEIRVPSEHVGAVSVRRDEDGNGWITEVRTRTRPEIEGAPPSS